MSRVALLAAVLSLAGCAGNTSRRPPLEVFADMDRQGTNRPQRVKDERPVPGTVAVGHLNADSAYATGQANGMYVGANPLPINKATLERGQERFNIYCAPCHDQTGGGHGIVPTRVPSWLPTNLLEQRVRNMVDGELYTVIAQGRRSMPAYRFQIPEPDRWAIVAYVRALQRSSAGTIDDVPPELRGELR
jgi:mono/diheme cytochrome c family protein